MLSEFENHRRKKLFDDLVDIELIEADEDDIVRPDCGCVFFKLNLQVGVICADPGCNTVIDLSATNEE
jgi:hypothetical protein